MDQADEPPSTELWIIQTRLSQGLTPHIEDLQTLLQIVQLLGLADGGHVKADEP